MCVQFLPTQRKYRIRKNYLWETRTKFWNAASFLWKSTSKMNNNSTQKPLINMIPTEMNIHWKKHIPDLVLREPRGTLYGLVNESGRYEFIIWEQVARTLKLQCFHDFSKDKVCSMCISWWLGLMPKYTALAFWGLNHHILSTRTTRWFKSFALKATEKETQVKLVRTSPSLFLGK